MTTKNVPYLCGGILFSLILQARKTRTKARDRFNSGSDGLKDTDVMMGLVEVVTGDNSVSCHGNTFGKATSQFKTCKTYGTTYIPFTEPSVISSFNYSLKQKDSDLLNRMSEFINKFINEMRYEWLVKSLVEVIQNDVGIDKHTSFYISLEETAIKDNLNSITKFELPVFLLSVLSFIINERPDNTLGRQTFEKWHTQSGKKSQWRFTSSIGTTNEKRIVVKTSIEYQTNTDTVVIDDFTKVVESETQPKSPKERIEDKIFASGKALANAWGNVIENIAGGLDGEKTETTSVQLPEEQADKSPYSSADNLLLQEFTADYDEIMIALIGENYGASLANMSLHRKIQDLYESKWISKADDFINPMLKSYVYGLLGELNSISSSFLVGGRYTPFLKNIRIKIRNLYVKLHPEQFAGAFPYDAFIDDWNDGEF